MNDPRYRKPARPVHPNASWRAPRENPEEPPPTFDEEFDPRPPRGPRGPGVAPDRWLSRGPADPGPLPGRRALRDRDAASPGPQRRLPRDRDAADPGFERRPRRSRDPDMPPPRGPRYPDAERVGRGMGRPEGREDWPDPRDWEPGMRPRRPSRPPGTGRPPARRKKRAARRLRRRYRYGALLGVMLFATVGGVCLGFSGIGTHGASVGLILASIPALLLSIGCAGVYVYV